MGLFRDIATTNLLGASVFHDIFIVVLKIPNVFRRFFAEGAFSLAFIPIYKSLLSNKKSDEAAEFINSLLGLMLLILFIFTLLALIFAPILIFLFAPGFYFDADNKSLAVDILRIMFPYLALVSLVSFAAGIQNSHNYFSIPAATPLIFNVILIIFAIFISDYFTIPVFALAWGVLLAGFVQLFIQVFPLRRIGISLKINFRFSNPNILKFKLLILPAILAGGVTQINLLIDTIFASLLATGSPTWLYVSDRLMQFPLGIFAIAIGTVLLPNLSRYFSTNNLSKFRSTLLGGIKLVIYIGIPSALGLIVFGYHILEMLFQRGAFSTNDVLMSNLSLQMLSIGLPFFMLMKVLFPSFFAQQDTKTPLYVSLLSLFLNVVLNYFLAFYLGLGHYGLALGSSISAFIAVSILFVYLKINGFISLGMSFLSFVAKVIFSTLLMVVFLLGIINFIDFTSISGIISILSILGIIFLAASVFLLSSMLMGIKLKDLIR